MYDNSKYAYIVGRLRAMDTKMLNASVLDRLMEAPGAAEAFRSLNDLSLVASSLNDYEVQDFNKVLADSTQNMKELLIQMAPYPELLDFLWYKYDFHNLKVALRAKITEYGYEDVNHAISPLGTVDAEAWQAFVLEDKSIPLMKDLGKLVATAAELYEKTNDPQVINMVVDQQYVLMLKEVADKMKSGMLDAYLKRVIDFSNLRAFIRVTELSKDRQDLEKLLLSGGFVKTDLFLTSFERGYDDLKQALEKPIGSDDLSKALDKFLETKNLITIEKEVFRLQQDFMAKSSVVTFGPEPVFAFFWKFENHMVILRSILVGKLNGLSNDTISEHILAL
jgi:V/A-type H+-transporting ATPase subunit C